MGKSRKCSKCINYKEYKVINLIPAQYDGIEFPTRKSYFEVRHCKRKWRHFQEKVGDYRSWKKYRKFQYREIIPSSL